MIDFSSGVQKFDPSTPEQMGVVTNPLQTILQGYSSVINAKYLDKEKQAALAKQISDTLHAQAQTKLENIYSGLPMGGKIYPGAAGQEQGLEAIRQQYGEDSQQYKQAADTQKRMQDAIVARTNSYGGVGVQLENDEYKNVASDNPQLGSDPKKIREATNVLKQGGRKLSDGTILNEPTSQTLGAFDRAGRTTTTAPVITNTIRANQADQEIKVLDQYAQKALAQAGTTYANKSPDAILASFGSDEASQKKLGRIIAAQALQYEIAQNRIRIAGGQPGVTSTEELMKSSGQTLNTNFPRLTYAARQEASNYLNDALSEGLEARNKVRTGASSVTNPATYKDLKNSIKKSGDEFNKQTIPFKGKKGTKYEGQTYDVPQGKVQDWISSNLFERAD